MKTILEYTVIKCVLVYTITTLKDFSITLILTLTIGFNKLLFKLITIFNNCDNYLKLKSKMVTFDIS